MPEWVGPAIAAAALVTSIANILSNKNQGTERRITALETKVELMFKDVSFAAAFAARATLHHPTDRLRLDTLIELDQARQLTREQLAEFVDRLQEVRDNSEDPDEQHAADVLLRALKIRYSH